MTVENFETHPDNYMHWQLSVDGEVATLTMDIREEDPDSGYVRKMNR